MPSLSTQIHNYTKYTTMEIHKNANTQIQEGSEPARGPGGRQGEGEKYWGPAQQHNITYRGKKHIANTNIYKYINSTHWGPAKQYHITYRGKEHIANTNIYKYINSTNWGPAQQYHITY